MFLKKLLAITLFLLPIYIYAQDITYIDINEKKVKSKEKAAYYKIIKRDSISPVIKVERTYFLSGKIKKESHLLDLPDDNGKNKIVSKQDGKYKEWYENGQLRKEIDYVKGKYNGKVLTYWENGQLKRDDNFQDGKSINGKCFGADGKEINYYPYEIMPEFPGGEYALMQYIAKNLKYPVRMQEQKIQGKVVIGFYVEKNGWISDIEVMRSVSYGLDDEAKRVVNSLPKWKPGMQDGEIVRVHYALPISYRLE